MLLRQNFVYITSQVRFTQVLGCQPWVKDHGDWLISRTGRRGGHIQLQQGGLCSSHTQGKGFHPSVIHVSSKTFRQQACEWPDLTELSGRVDGAAVFLLGSPSVPMPGRITRLFSFASAAMIKHCPKATRGGRGLFYLTLPGHWETSARGQKAGLLAVPCHVASD